MKRKILASILIVLCFATLCSCANSGGDITTEEITTASAVATENGNVETTENIYDEYGYIKDKLADNINFDNQTLRVLYWNDVENQEFFAESENGEAVNDAIFKRNARVEDRLKIKLDFVGMKGNWSNYETLCNAVKNSISGGTDVYDVIAAYSLTTGVCAYRGYLQTLNDKPYIDLSAEWWPDTLNTTSTIKGKLYFASGDISTNVLYMMYGMYYNKAMVTDLNLTDPYSYVENGKWTLDRMIELSKNIYSDDDNDGVESAGDRFGQACYGLHMDAFLTGSNITLIETTGNGEMALGTVYMGSKTEELTTKLYNYLHSKDAYIFGDGTYKKIFTAGKSLFITDRVDIAIFDLAEKEFDMGILPIPKYDENQEDYLNVVGNPFTLYGVPTNCSNTDAACAFLECSASESYRNVTPMIFELCMKSKYADGGSDVVSYDILRKGIVYDLGRLFGRVFDVSTTSPGTLYTNAIKSNSPSWTTRIATNKNVLNKVINNLNKSFEG